MEVKPSPDIEVDMLKVIVLYEQNLSPQQIIDKTGLSFSKITNYITTYLNYPNSDVIRDLIARDILSKDK